MSISFHVVKLQVKIAGNRENRQEHHGSDQEIGREVAEHDHHSGEQERDEGPVDGVSAEVGHVFLTGARHEVDKEEVGEGRGPHEPQDHEILGLGGVDLAERRDRAEHHGP